GDQALSQCSWQTGLAREVERPAPQPFGHRRCIAIEVRRTIRAGTGDSCGVRLLVAGRRSIRFGNGPGAHATLDSVARGTSVDLRASSKGGRGRSPYVGRNCADQMMHAVPLAFRLRTATFLFASVTWSCALNS